MNLSLNTHGNVVLCAQKGILITGDSGSGKSSLAIGLISELQSSGIFSCLVCDDQVLLTAINGRLKATCPSPISGLIEIHGLGIVEIANQDDAIIHGIVELADASDLIRQPDPCAAEYCGLSIPKIQVSRTTVQIAIMMVCHFVAGL